MLFKCKCFLSDYFFGAGTILDFSKIGGPDPPEPPGIYAYASTRRVGHGMGFLQNANLQLKHLTPHFHTHCIFTNTSVILLVLFTDQEEQFLKYSI